MFKIKVRLFLSLSAGATIFSSFSALAQDNFYAGKQVRIYAQEQASGYSLYAQLISRHLGRFLPGKPTVVVGYMPGAAGLILTNYLYEVAPRDGATLAVPDQDLATKQARKLKGVRYDASQFTYIGRATANVPVHMAWHTTGVSRIEELKQKTLLTGAVGMEGTHVDLPKAQNQLLGFNWKIISGYRGNNQIRLAMERGELGAGIAPATLFNEQLKPWIAEGKVTILLQYSEARHPLFPDVPTIVELAERPEDKALFKFLVSLSTFGRSLVAPPNLPTQRTELLRNAFEEMLTDKAFLAEAEKMGADLIPMKGQDLAGYMSGILNTPAEIVATANRLIDGN
jgi:tripartite-type tricarboxylate transporter receptor subunit TctC